MVAFFWLLGLPIVVIVMLAKLILKKDFKGLPLGILFFCLAVASGLWSIKQSHSSTAGIGILFLPFAGSLSGLFSVIFVRFKKSPEVMFFAGSSPTPLWIAYSSGLSKLR